MLLRKLWNPEEDYFYFKCRHRHTHTPTHTHTHAHTRARASRGQHLELPGCVANILELLGCVASILEVIGCTGMRGLVRMIRALLVPSVKMFFLCAASPGVACPGLRPIQVRRVHTHTHPPTHPRTDRNTHTHWEWLGLYLESKWLLYAPGGRRIPAHRPPPGNQSPCPCERGAAHEVGPSPSAAVAMRGRRPSIPLLILSFSRSCDPLIL